MKDKNKIYWWLKRVISSCVSRDHRITCISLVRIARRKGYITNDDSDELVKSLMYWNW